MTLPPPRPPHAPSGAFPARAVPVRTLPPISTTQPSSPSGAQKPKPEKPKPATAAAPTPIAPASAARSDIQGLRALAVVAVILNHLVGWPRGGFVGVDVFFVISGFLITGMLLRDGERDGAAALPRFYARRIKRILPAALVVLVVTVIGARLLFLPERAAGVVGDAISALLISANVHFASAGTDYFHALSAPSPLQHFWSLSIEEQFYLVWPALIVVLFAVVTSLTGRRAGGRVAVGVLAVVLTVVSFAWAMADTRVEPAAAYFATFGRVWELAAGAAIAAFAPALARLTTGARGVLGWLGLAGIVVSFVVIDGSTGFPAPWAALPVAATALVILAGTGGEQRALLPLQNPVAHILGDISYSLYLWHFPVIAFLLVLVPTQSILTTAIIGAIILVLSVACYFLVEQPLHRSPLFESLPDAHARAAAWEAWRGRTGTTTVGALIALGAVVVGVVLLSGATLNGQNPLAAAQQSQPTQNSVQAELQAADAATAWPALTPSVDEAVATGTLDNPARGCFDPATTPSLASCTWGLSSAPHQLYLVGDSTALAYAPAFKVIAESSGGQWRVTTVGLYGCRFTDVIVRSDDQSAVDACSARKDWVAQQIATDHPDLVVVSNDFTEAQATDGSALSVDALVASAVSQAQRYDAAGRVVYLAPPPLGADLGQYYSTVSGPQSCTVDVNPTWNAFAASMKHAAGATHARFVSSLAFSCADGRCPPFAGSIPTKFDSVHMTATYAMHIAPVLKQEFVAQGLL